MMHKFLISLNGIGYLSSYELEFSLSYQKMPFFCTENAFSPYLFLFLVLSSIFVAAFL